MPEYPDIMVYIDALEQRIVSRVLRHVALQSPFLLRTALPPIDTFIQKEIVALERIGKRIVLGFASTPRHSTPDLWMVFHLMIAGRFQWKPIEQNAPGKSALITLHFDNGYLYLTEAGSKKRASLHLFDQPDALEEVDPGGLEVLEIDFETFAERFTASNHTLKRALTDPRILSGIGNAYSDEILHRAKMSPITLTQKMTNVELKHLFEAIRETLRYWKAHLSDYYGDKFPTKVTAFRDDMAVHGRYDQPCPVCGTPVQRIRYATNETNYCPTCQTGGRVLADRALSRLLKNDWPRTVEAIENLKSEKK